MQTIKIKTKNVFGRDLFYPECQLSQKLAEFSGSKTFTEFDLKQQEHGLPSLSLWLMFLNLQRRRNLMTSSEAYEIVTKNLGERTGNYGYMFKL